MDPTLNHPTSGYRDGPGRQTHYSSAGAWGTLDGACASCLFHPLSLSVTGRLLAAVAIGPLGLFAAKGHLSCPSPAL